MGFHNNWTILVKHLHSEEVKNARKKRFCLNFLNSINTKYSCSGTRQIILVWTKGAKYFLYWDSHTSDVPCQGPKKPVLADRWGSTACPGPDPHITPRAISPCPIEALAGLGSSSTWPCPAWPWGHKTKILHFFQVKLTFTCLFHAFEGRFCQSFQWSVLILGS